MTKKLIRMLIELVCIGLLIFADQITKVWAVANLKEGRVIELIPGVLQFNYLENQGAAFGILQNHQTFFVIAGAIILFLVMYLLFVTPHERRYNLLSVLLVMIVAGAVGNMIDRVNLGYVVDFIYVSAINFPIFNVADCYVTVSTIMLAFAILFYYQEEDLTVYWLKKKEHKDGTK